MSALSAHHWSNCASNVNMICCRWHACRLLAALLDSCVLVEETMELTRLCLPHWLQVLHDHQVAQPPLPS